MTDPKQKTEAPADVPVAIVAPGKVRLRHPHTGDTKEVDAIPEALVPIMCLGYQQVKE
jgi:hypothetical protein